MDENRRRFPEEERTGSFTHTHTHKYIPEDVKDTE